MSTNASTSTIPVHPPTQLSQQLHIDWDVLSFILFSPHDQLKRIIENADLQPQEKRDALGALAEVLENYADIAIYERLYRDTMTHIQRFRDRAVEGFRGAVSTANKARLAQIIRTNNRLEQTGGELSLLRTPPNEGDSVDSLVKDFTPCLQCLDSTITPALPHRHIDCPEYRCRKCDRPAPGHVPEHCPNVDQRTGIPPGYRPLTYIIRNAPVTSDHNTHMLAVAADATIKSFDIPRSRDRPEHLRPLSPISTRIRRAETTRPRSTTWVVYIGSIRGIFNDRSRVRHLTQHYRDHHVERFDSYEEARARANELFREGPAFDNVNHIRRVKRLAAISSALPASRTSQTDALIADSDNPPPSYHTDNQSRRSSPSPPPTPIVLRHRHRERPHSPWEDNSDHRGYNANRLRVRALEPVIRLDRNDEGTNIGVYVKFASSNVTIGRVLLVGEEWIVEGSSEDPMTHNRERPPSNYAFEEMLLYPLDTGTIIYLFDGRADVNVARIVYLGQEGGILIPVPRSKPNRRSTHSSDEYWDQLPDPFSAGESPPRHGELGYRSDDAF